MTKASREQRIGIIEQIEQLLADNCRKCPVQRSGGNWGVNCRPAPVCPVLEPLQALGRELGFDEPAPRNKPLIPLDESLVQRARRNNIPREIYISRINAGRDPVEAAEIPHFRPREDREFLRLALSRNIARSTYGSRIDRGWTPQEAASYKPGVKLEDIRGGRASGLYIV